LRRAEAFIRWTVTEFFGLQLEDVSRAILLLDDEVRGRVVLAERCAAESDYRLALAHLNVAFEAAIRSQKSWDFDWAFIEQEIKTAVGRATGTEFGRQPASVSTHGLIEVLKRVANRLEDVDQVVQAIAVGADPEFVVSTLLRWQKLPPALDRSARRTAASETLLENPERERPET
jgi:hypothetical protein